MNDDLFFCLVLGFVKMKFNIKCFIELYVEFEDGSIVINVDVVVLVIGWFLVWVLKKNS